MRRGLFITFEGIDGCGKSTQIEIFKGLLDAKNIPYLALREPGGTRISESIRNILLDAHNAEMADQTEVLLFAAARAQLVSERILPALNSGICVLCDRYIDSSIAYQAYGRELGEEFVKSANSFSMANCMPDRTLFFNVSPLDVKTRLEGRGSSDRMESEKTVFHERVFHGYLSLLRQYPERIISIDASKSIEQVSKEVKSAAKDIFQKW